MSLERVEKIKSSLLGLAPDIFGNFPVLFAYLYGSYATGLVHPFSDLDIGIYVEEISRRQYLELELSLAVEIDEKLGGVLHLRAPRDYADPFMVIEEEGLVPQNDTACPVECEAYSSGVNPIGRKNI